MFIEDIKEDADKQNVTFMVPIWLFNTCLVENFFWLPVEKQCVGLNIDLHTVWGLHETSSKSVHNCPMCLIFLFICWNIRFYVLWSGRLFGTCARREGTSLTMNPEIWNTTYSSLSNKSSTTLIFLGKLVLWNTVIPCQTFIDFCWFGPVKLLFPVKRLLRLEVLVLWNCPFQ